MAFLTIKYSQPNLPAMDYLTLARTYEGIEATSKRLEMTDLLVELIKQVLAVEVEMVRIVLDEIIA